MLRAFVAATGALVGVIIFLLERVTVRVAHIHDGINTADGTFRHCGGPSVLLNGQVRCGGDDHDKRMSRRSAGSSSEW